jgi:hypothetical protein
MPPQTVYEHETEVVWEKNPSNLKYLREFSIDTRKRTGLPTSRTKQYVVYGYTNVSQSAPTAPDGCIRKRMFVLKPKDAGGPENNGEYWQGPNTPVEAVEIDSIQAGHPSTKMQP